MNQRNLSSPREPASEPRPASRPPNEPPGGARITHGPSKPDTIELLECLVEGFRNAVWILAGQDREASAALLALASSKIEEEARGDRRRAKSEARARAAREQSTSASVAREA